MDIRAVEQLKKWRDHPEIMVRELFGVTPDPWQDEVLAAFPKSQRMAMKAAKGCGKSTVEAWLAWNFLLTRRHPKVIATSISANNLADGLWTEMAKWRNAAPMLQNLFTWTKTRIFANDNPDTWFMAARTWSKSADREQQANTLAGIHADYVLFILDESGGIPDAVMAAAEAALSTGIETHMVQAGNPTHLEGPLYRACTIERRLWKVFEITGDPDDPKRSSRISIKWAREQIEKWGRENPYVLVNVFGQFPPASINALIGPDEVSAATRRIYTEYQIGRAALVLGVDVARFGNASSVISPRRGIQMFNRIVRRGLDSIQGSGLVARTWENMDADGCLIDDTGGFGSGWIDQLRVLNRSPIPIHFAGQAHDSKRYANKRTEMYFDYTQWIKSGGALPPESAGVIAALPVTTYTFTKDGRMLLEPKELIESKIGYSPDEADADALTFGEPISPRQQNALPMNRRPYVAQQDFNPFREQAQPNVSGGTYDPFDPNRR